MKKRKSFFPQFTQSKIQSSGKGRHLLRFKKKKGVGVGFFEKLKQGAFACNSVMCNNVVTVKPYLVLVPNQHWCFQGMFPCKSTLPENNNAGISASTFQHLIMVVTEYWEGFENCNAAKGSYSVQGKICRRVKARTANSAPSRPGAAVEATVPDPGSGGPFPRASHKGSAGSGSSPGSGLQHLSALTRIKLWPSAKPNQAKDACSHSSHGTFSSPSSPCRDH